MTPYSYQNVRVIEGALGIGFRTNKMPDGTFTARILVIGSIQRIGDFHHVAGEGNGKTPEAAICDAFAKAYEEVEVQRIETNNLVVCVADLRQLCSELAKAYGIPITGNLVSIPV